MTIDLLLALLPLALLDCLNPVSIGGVAYLLLSPRPLARSASFIAGVFVAYFAGGVLVFIGMGAALRDLFSQPGGPASYVALAVVGALLLAAGLWVRRSPPSGETAQKAGWGQHPTSAFLCGAVATASDLPTAFPYIIGVERMVAAGMGLVEVLGALALYNAVFVLPLLVMLGAYLRLRGGSAAFLRGCERRLTEWSRPAMVWAMYALGAFLLVNSALYFALGQPLV